MDVSPVQPPPTTAVPTPSSPPNPPKEKDPSPVLVILLAVLLGTTISVVFFFKNIRSLPLFSRFIAYTNDAPAASAAVVPTPTATYLPPGQQTYSIGQSADMKGPRITSITLNPLDPAKDSGQGISVAIDSPTTSQASLTIYTDTHSYPLTLTKNGKAWTTQWMLPDSINARYIIVIRATDTNGTAKVIVSPRTPGPLNSNDFL